METVLDQEPDEAWLLVPLLRVAMACMQSNKIAEALLIYKRLLRYPPQVINNAIIATCMVQYFESAASFSDLAQVYVKEIRL